MTEHPKTVYYVRESAKHPIRRYVLYYSKAWDCSFVSFYLYIATCSGITALEPLVCMDIKNSSNANNF